MLLLFPALFIARRTRAYIPAMYAASVLLMVIAAVWVMDRAFGSEVSIDRWVFAVIEFPRSLLLIAGFYLVAAALYFFDKSRDALLPVYVSEDEELVPDRATVDEGAQP